MFSRIFAYALQNITRNTFLSLSSLLILTLLMFFINILIVLHGVSFRLIDGVNDKLTISLYLNESYDKNSLDIIELQNDIKKTIPSIGVRYKTKQEVLEDIRKRDPELVSILELENPLPETITLDNIPLKDYETLNTLIEKRFYVLLEQDEINKDTYFSSYTKQFERISTVIQILNILQIGLYIIIVTFIVSIAIIVYSIIGNFIYYYRDEIYITRLVGGDKFFIFGPFTLQAMMYVGASFLLSLGIFFALYYNIANVFGFVSIEEFYPGNFAQIILLQAGVFLTVGGLSGYISSQKYITKK